MVFKTVQVKNAVVLFVVFGFMFFPSFLYSLGKVDKEKGTGTDNSRIQPNETPFPSVMTENSRKILLGTNDGLFSVDPAGNVTELWSGGAVKKILILSAGTTAGSEVEDTTTVAILGSEGIFVSTNLRDWEKRNHGLPVKAIKIFQNGKKSFLTMVQEIKDLKIIPDNPQIMVCATSDQVYLSRNQGHSWVNLGAPPYRTNGIKAVAAAYMPELTVFLSHSTYGVFYIQPDRDSTRWIELGEGLETLETTDNPDEISDIAVLPTGINRAELYVSQTFRRRIYRLDWSQKKFDLVWSDTMPFGTVDSLNVGKTGLYFLYEGSAASLSFQNFVLQKRPDIVNSIRSVPAQLRPNCAVFWENQAGDDRIILSELWLLNEPEPETSIKPARTNTVMPFALQTVNKEGLYLPVNHAMDNYSLGPYLNVINRGGLNMIVIDMKDDYGRLRFTPKNSAISGKGRVFRPLNLETFLGDMKERGIYTVARVVVFKDPELAAKENGRFAVWDEKNNKPWVGYTDSRQKKSNISDNDRSNRLKQFFPASDPEYEIVRTFYDERWVDPYSEEVWEYTAAVAEELHEWGFDEIQFDYIRFPTDGINLGEASYRWQDNGMDMESAILSFLRHIKSRVKAPISIDIYGANGWYRTGARTGQEVELLAPWVDVICPMYYPSHFEQYFLAQSPPELRPWRIYYHGTLRASRIGRGQVIVRPYVQAFFLNVSYDRIYYNPDYVRHQVDGTRAAGYGGLTYWNNSGRYDDIPDR
jgi:hypothetical protein